MQSQSMVRGPVRQPKTVPITDEYEISNTVLGLGINGKVVQCTNRISGQKYALKILHDNAKARREVDLHWRASGCRHIVNIIDVYENSYSEKACLLVVMEWYVIRVTLDDEHERFCIKLDQNGRSLIDSRGQL